MQDTFLLALFQGGTFQIPWRAITVMPLKQAGIDLLDPTLKVGANWTASCVITRHLVAALRGMDKSRSGNHYLPMGEVREEIR